MWLYRTSSNADHAITLYEYAPGRAGKYPEVFLEGFNGVNEFYFDETKF